LVGRNGRREQIRKERKKSLEAGDEVIGDVFFYNKQPGARMGDQRPVKGRLEFSAA